MTDPDLGTARRGVQEGLPVILSFLPYGLILGLIVAAMTGIAAGVLLDSGRIEDVERVEGGRHA